MKTKHVLLVLVALALAIMPLASDSSDAATLKLDGKVSVGTFSDMGEGSITVTVHNEFSEKKTVTVAVYDTSNNKMLTKSTFDVSANGETSKEISLSYGSAGTKYITVKLFEGTSTDGAVLSEQSGIVINVSHSIWKDTTTYILIIVAIIAVAVILYVRSKGLPLTKSKEEVSFTELNRERRSRKRQSSSTERKRYEGGRKGN